MKTIIGIKTSDGYYITDDLRNNTSGYSSYAGLSGYIINGEQPQSTFHKSWNKVKEEPKTVQQWKSMPNINFRYELKDESLSATFKKVYPKDEVDFGYDADDSKIWAPEFASISSLYELKSDPQEKVLEDVEFEYYTIEEIDEIKAPVPFSYKRVGGWNDSVSLVVNGTEQYDMIDKVITPEVLLHTKPCKLSREQSYGIVRAYIKENINPKVAEITSDYEFCLTVKKKIKLVKPHTYQVDVNDTFFGKRKKKPKYETRTQTFTSIDIYRTAPKAYQSYPVIEPFEAEDSDSLKEYIDNFLEHLIGVINEPLVLCECCNGTGVKLIEETP